MITLSHLPAEGTLAAELGVDHPGWIVAKWDDGYVVVLVGTAEMLEDIGAIPVVEEMVEEIRKATDVR